MRLGPSQRKELAEGNARRASAKQPPARPARERQAGDYGWTTSRVPVRRRALGGCYFRVRTLRRVVGATACSGGLVFSPWTSAVEVGAKSVRTGAGASAKIRSTSAANSRHSRSSHTYSTCGSSASTVEGLFCAYTIVVIPPLCVGSARVRR